MRAALGLVILVLGLTLGLVGPLYGAEAYAVGKVLSGDSLTLTDGRTVRLLAVKAPDAPKLAEASRRMLEEWIGKRNVSLAHQENDRYGRVVAEVHVEKNTETAAAAMVKAGQVFVFPPQGTEPGLPELLKLERVARQQHRGLWADAAYADIAADDVDAAYNAKGSFAFVRGKIVDAVRVKNKVYLNFGADWHDDFTAQIAAKDLRVFKNAGLDPLSLKGKVVRVRGMVESMFGPMMTIKHPAQVEILE